MKNMDEFRRSVYEKAEKKAAEEKAKKLKITKFAAMAAAFAVIVIPAIFVAGSLPKENVTEKFSQTYTGSGYYGNSDTSGKLTIEYAETTTANEEAYTTDTTAPVYTTTPVFTTTTPVFTQIETTRAETKAGDTSMAETIAAVTGDSATVTVGGKDIALTQGMTYKKVCELLGGEGRMALGAPVYRWECDDGVVISVRFEVTGKYNEPPEERLRAVSFTVMH